MPDSKLIVALDVADLGEAENWVDRLLPHVRTFKVGSILFTKEGPRVIDMIHRKKGDVFLDLKFHDIPNTVAEACRVATRLGVWMLNLHSMGGTAVLRESVSAVNEESSKKRLRKPILIGVTLLTHLDKAALGELGWTLSGEVQEEVAHLAKLTKSVGLDGVVCSPQEIQPVRAACGEKFVIVTPGIRPVGSLLHDQKRVSSPREAVQAGADYIVVGRPILESKNPAGTVRSILEEIR